MIFLVIRNSVNKLDLVTSQDYYYLGIMASQANNHLRKSPIHLRNAGKASLSTSMAGVTVKYVP